MTDTQQTLEARVTHLERRFEAAEARAEERHSREIRIEEKVDLLVQDKSRREGRETAEQRTRLRDRETRHELSEWLRSFVPTGFWVGIFAAVAWVLRQLGIGSGQ